MRDPDCRLSKGIIWVSSPDSWWLRSMDGWSVWVTLPLRETAGEYTTLTGRDEESRGTPELSWLSSSS